MNPTAPAVTAALLFLAACQPLPHPFADDRPPPNAPILTVKDTVGVVVTPATGTAEPAATALAEAMASALRDIEVPATTTAGNKHSFKLSAEVARVPATGLGLAEIRWTMRGYDGKDVGEDRQHVLVTAATWQDGTAPQFADAAKMEAPKLAALIQDAPPAEHQPVHKLFVRPVEGAPGDGGRALPSALTYLLKQKGIEVTKDAGAADTITIAGQIAVSPVPPDKEHVQITWHVLTPDGADYAQVGQENTIQRGSLDGKWGEIAMAVAMAGVDDILKVVGSAVAPG